MQTLVLRITDALDAEIQAEAKRLNTTKSAVARLRLAASSGNTKAAASGFNLIADLIGSDTAEPDLSARKKHYLKTTGFGREKPRR